MEPKRRYAKDSEVSRRRFSRIFFLPSVQQNKISVCQKMFLGTLGYSTEEAIRTIHKSTNYINILRKDLRGKHNPNHKITDEEKNFIEQHIMKFNPGISHYRRAHVPNRLYLPSELNCAEMYEDYEICCQENNRKVLSYITYWRVIKTMNISVAKLGIDECETCDEYRIHKEEIMKQNEWNVNADIKRKKRKMDAVTYTEVVCSTGCKKCEDFMDHILRRNRSHKDYEKDKELTG